MTKSKIPWAKISGVFLSRKFLATFAVATVLIVFHRHTVSDLDRIDPAKASALTTIYITTSGTLGAILVGYLGFNTLQTRFGLSGMAQVMGQHTESVSEHTERIIEEGEQGAPERRPWTQIHDDP